MKIHNSGSFVDNSNVWVLCSPQSATIAAQCVGALKNYKENRENGEENDNPQYPFPSSGFEGLDIKTVAAQDKKWPDEQGRYWWKITLNDGRIINDFFWIEDKHRGFPEKDEQGNDRYKWWYIVYNSRTSTPIEGFCQEPDYEKGFPDKYQFYNYFIKYTECGPIKTWMEEKDLNYLRRIKRESPSLFQREFAELKIINPSHPAVTQLILEVNAYRQHLAAEQEERQLIETPSNTKPFMNDKLISSAHLFQPSPVPPLPPQPPTVFQMHAAYAHQDTRLGYLSFNRGDILTVLAKNNEWWFCDLRGLQGWAPSNYLEPMPINTSSNQSTLSPDFMDLRP